MDNDRNTGIMKNCQFKNNTFFFGNQSEEMHIWFAGFRSFKGCDLYLSFSTLFNP